MKKCIALLLAAVMVFGIAFSASAVSGQYRMARLFMEYMDANGIRYSYKGVDSDSSREEITVGWNCDNISSVLLHFFFYENNRSCSIRVWNMIDYDPADHDEVVKVCDSMNVDYRFVRFYTDTNDNSVTAAIDVFLLDQDNAPAFLDEYMSAMVEICDEAYPNFAPYAK